MVAESLSPLPVALAVALFAGCAEWLHRRRVRRLAVLAFGSRAQPASWARLAPLLRVVALSGLAWALATLLVLEPERHSLSRAASRLEHDPQHVLLVLDVSPSMRLVDAGPQKNESRMQRARVLMESFFDRVPIESYRVSVIAVYNGAKAVVIDTTDFEVVRNILGDLPMHYAFQSGKTRLLDGLEEAARVAATWSPRSTTLLLVSDGDTVPAIGMPKLPASIKSVLIVGVGDPRTGKFIDGAQSRQDIPTLKQIAARLGGTFHNGNEQHLSSTLIAEATGLEDENVFEKLSRRDYALIAAGTCGLVCALLPFLLHVFGTNWRPGTAPDRGNSSAAMRVDARAARLRRNRKSVVGVG